MSACAVNFVEWFCLQNMVSVVKKEIEEFDRKLDRAAKMVLYGLRGFVSILSYCCEVVWGPIFRKSYDKLTKNL